MDLLSSDDMPSKPGIIKGGHDHDSSPQDHGENLPTSNAYPVMPTFNADDIIGRTFLLPENGKGERHRARIVKAIEDFESNLENDPDRVKLLCSINNEEREDLRIQRHPQPHLTG